VQQYSEHHIAHGMVRKAQEKKMTLYPVQEFHAMPGIGVSGKVNGKSVLAVGPNYFSQHQLALPASSWLHSTRGGIGQLFNP
jgi:Cu2+-exporting ATPase